MKCPPLCVVCCVDEVPTEWCSKRGCCVVVAVWMKCPPLCVIVDVWMKCRPSGVQRERVVL